LVVATFQNEPVAAWGIILLSLPSSLSITPSRICALSSSPLDFDSQWMLLDLGHQQDLALLLFGDLKV
jgi:hypothetical protein